MVIPTPPSTDKIKFFNSEGEEIKGVVKFSIPETGNDDIVLISLTFPLLKSSQTKSPHTN